MNEQLILAYLAGIMDADGCFTIRRSTYGIRVRKDSNNPTYAERVCIKQVNKEAVDIIHKMFGGYLCIAKPNANKGKPLYSLDITHIKAHNFIKAIYPYLRIKKRQAQILLELRENLKAKEGKSTKDSFIKNQWGAVVNVTKRCVSKEQIKFREELLKEIKSLNDSRNDIHHQPKPYLHLIANE